MKKQVNLLLRLMVIFSLTLQLLPVSVIAETITTTEQQTSLLSSIREEVSKLKGEKLLAYLEKLTTEEQTIVKATLTPAQLTSLQQLSEVTESESTSTTSSLETTETTEATEAPTSSSTSQSTTEASPEEEEVTEGTTTSSKVESKPEEKNKQQEEPKDEPKDQPYVGAAVNLLSAGPLVAGKNENTNNLVLNKTATYNPSTKQVDFQLDVFAKGEEVTKMNPTDIVFVLDVSGSMDYSMGSTTRIAALKTAVKNFAATMENEQKKLSPDQFHTLQIVTYSTSSYIDPDVYQTNRSNDLRSFSSQIDDLTAYGATRQDLGLNSARSVVSSNESRTGRKANQVVILFTDGEPSPANADSVTTVANIAGGAVNIANSLKNTYQTTVYSVGIQNNANPSIINSKDIPNSMLNGISSNYKNARAGNNTSSQSYSYTNNLIIGTRTVGGNYYLTTNTAGGLSSLFTSIATQIGKVENVTIRDVLSSQLLMPIKTGNQPDLSSVKVYRGWDKPSATQVTNPQIKYDQGTKTLDFPKLTLDPVIMTNNNQPTADSKKNKIIITFSAAVEPEFMGGNQVITNKDNSGVYVTNSQNEESLHSAFTQPVVNIPLKNQSLGVTDHKVYLGDRSQLKDFFKNLTLFNGENNSHVKATFTVSKNNQNLLTKEIAAGQVYAPSPETLDHTGDIDTTYDVSYQLVAANGPASGSTGVTPVGEKKQSQVYVFKPTLVPENRSIYLTNKVDQSKKLPTISQWTHPKSASLTNLAFSSEAPTISQAKFTLPATLTKDEEVGTVTEVTLSNNKKITSQLNFKIFVFKPEITSTNTTIDLGETTDLAARSSNPVWKNPNSPVPIVEGSAPNLTKQVFEVANSTALSNNVSPIIDTNYRWKIRINNQEITEFTTFVNKTYANQPTPAQTHFTVYVKRGSLKIKKEITTPEKRSYGNESFIFEVRYQKDQLVETYYATVTLGEAERSGEVVLTNLKPGSYLVKEMNPWSSRYTAEKGEQTLALTTSKQGQLTFKNNLTKPKWLTNETKVENRFISQTPVNRADAQ